VASKIILFWKAFDISMMLINNPLEAAKLRRRQRLSIEATGEYESVKSIFLQERKVEEWVH